MLRLAYAVAIGTWLGSIVSLTYLITPIVHAMFEPHDARRVLRPFFPRHYGLGLACGFAALLTVVLGKESLPPPEAIRLAVPVALGITCTAVARQSLLPRLHTIPREDPRFGRLHQVAAMLNSTTLGALVLAMAAAVAR